MLLAEERPFAFLGILRAFEQVGFLDLTAVAMVDVPAPEADGGAPFGFEIFECMDGSLHGVVWKADFDFFTHHGSS